MEFVSDDLQQDCLMVLSGIKDMLEMENFAKAMEIIDQQNLNVDDLSHINICQRIASVFDWQIQPVQEPAIVSSPVISPIISPPILERTRDRERNREIRDSRQRSRRERKRERDEDEDIDINVRPLQQLTLSPPRAPRAPRAPPIDVQEEVQPQPERRTSLMRKIMKGREEKNVALMCAQLWVGQIDSLDNKTISQIKNVLTDKNIPYQQGEDVRRLCGKFINSMAQPGMPLGAFANKIIQDEDTRRREEEEFLRQEELRLIRRRRLNDLKRENDNLVGCTYNEQFFPLEFYQVFVIDDLGHNAHIEVSQNIYNSILRSNFEAPLVELTSLNGKKFHVRIIRAHEVHDNNIIISPLVAAILGGPMESVVSAKLCTNVSIPKKLSFIIFDGDDVDNIKFKVQSQLEAYLNRYAAFIVGMKVPMLIDDKLVTLVLEKIVDDSEQDVRVTQVPYNLEADYSIRTEREAYDEDGNLRDIPEEIPQEDQQEQINFEEQEPDYDN